MVDEPETPEAISPPPPPPPITEEAPAANADVVVEGKRRFRPRLPRPGRWGTIALIVAGSAVLLSAGGAAYATYRYGQEYRDRILPGSTIAGVDVGGLNEDQALSAVKTALEPQFTRVVTLEWNDHEWTVTPRELGARANAKAIVHEALSTSAETSFFKKAQMRLFGAELSFERPVGLRFPRQSVKGFVEGLASTLDREVADAELDYSTNWVKIRKEKEGRTVNVRPSLRSLLAALRDGEDTASLDIDTVDPEVTADEFDQVLLVRIGENKLYLYEDGKITHEWPVATGQPSYMTPTGLYEIVEKRYMPTWVNPAPDTWGASMPASIPPGYSNPLGLRALNWSAPAIRFHGTSATYSLGYNASHGCVRMANEDVIELYDLVDVGTPIVSVISGPLRPLYSSVSVDPVPVAEAENEAPAVDEAQAAEEDSPNVKPKDDGKGN
jgi:lipoprotein-anchoring transpeptidase ErfK/SrfK